MKNLITETRTNSGTTRRLGDMGHDPFAVTADKTLTTEMRDQIEDFYDRIDMDLLREAYHKDPRAFAKAFAEWKSAKPLGGRK